jgi:hypothetical protein
MSHDMTQMIWIRLTSCVRSYISTTMTHDF